MAPRLELQELLVDLLQSEQVYFQPPSNVQMQYPCIVYQKDFVLVNRADGLAYKKGTRYLVTVIDRDPDSLVPDRVQDLPFCTFDRFYTADNLNHNVFKLFF